MLPRRPSRAALLVPVVIFSLFATGLGAGLTRADTLPEPCGLGNNAEPAAGAEANLLMLSAITAGDADIQQVDEGPRPTREGPMTPGRVRAPNAPTPPPPPPVNEPARTNRGPITPPDAVITPRSPGTDLRPPDPAMLNLETVMVARQLRESLSNQQKADLQAVLARHQQRLQQVRERLPAPAADAQARSQVRRPSNAEQDDRLAEPTAELQAIGAEVDQEIQVILTPEQRALFQRAKPTRRRSELPALPRGPFPLGLLPAC